MAILLPPRTILAPILLLSWLALLGVGVEVCSMLYYERIAGLSFSSITSGLVFFLTYTPTNAILLFLLAFAARRSLGPPGAEHQDPDRADRADRFLKAVFAIVLTLAILTIARRHLLGFYSQGTYLIAACALSVLGWVLGAEGETAERWGGLIPFLTEPLGQHPSPVWATTLTYGEVALGFAVLGAWLFFFANGIMIPTIDYFNYLGDYNHINDLLYGRESLGKLILFWIIMFACYTQTNVGILCCLSGYFGMFFRRVSSISENPRGMTRDAGRRNATHDYVLATVSGFLVYLVLISGLAIFVGSEALRTRPAAIVGMVDYARFAAFASLSSFIEGYKPFLLGPLLQWFKEAMSRWIGGDSASSDRPPDSNVGGGDVSGAPSV